MTVEVKICGLDRPETVDGAVNAGAEMLGFVFYPPSPRNLTASAASRLTNRVPAGVKRVGLFVDPTDEMITTVLNQNVLDLIQLHGSESPERCKEIKNIFKVPIIKSFPILSDLDLKNIERYKNVSDMFLFDTKNENANGYNGGTGKSFDWNIIYKNKVWLKKQKPWILSGGLNPSNIKEAINITGAKAIDVSSGIEYYPGNKSRDLMKLFAYNAHNINSKV